MTTSPLYPGIRGPVPKTCHAETHRVIAPDQTLTRVRPFLAQMGITRVANITGLDRIGIPVVQVCRPNSRSLAGAQGKGLTLVAAKASGVMEAIEAFHAEHITLPVKYGSHEDLRHGHRLVDVTALNVRVRSIYHPHLPMLWVEGFDLLQQEPVWVPYELVHTNYTHPLPIGSGCFASTSNGLASGNHLLEAISHGVSEVVERDAATVWALGSQEAQDRSRIDPATVDHSGCREVLDAFARAGIQVGIWEITSDVGIPAFLCKILENAPGNQGSFAHLGYGCHPTRGIALLRALTEAVQTRLTVISGSRDDMARRDYERSENPIGLRGDQAHFEIRAPMRRFSPGAGLDTETFDEDIRWQLDCLRSVGIQRVVVVDLAKSDFGVPVVRVIIPGLEIAVVAPALFAMGKRARAVRRGRS